MRLPTTIELQSRARQAWTSCGLEDPRGDGAARTPITGGQIAEFPLASASSVAAALSAAEEAFVQWREVPAPARGELVRHLAGLLREHQSDLALLVSLEAGKISSEARGEVQEMIDICDLAVGQSRQLFGKTIASERPRHRLMETWHPLGPVAVITAFNFPVAVWAWNAAVALVCGDPVIWKPSDKAPLCALTCDALLRRAAERAGIDVPTAVHQVLPGGPDVAAALADHPGVALVSATGSTAMGRALAPRVAARLGRALLELGGNNAAVVAPSADLDLTVRAIVFAAAGTAGQRCTTLRRLIVHRSVADEVVERVSRAYSTLTIGDPMAPGTLVGPLIEARAYHAMAAALERASGEGGHVVTGGSRVLEEEAPDAYYARPAIVAMPRQSDLVRTETFAALLYVVLYEDLDEAVALHNDVPQGLASSIFTTDVREAEYFLSRSDCGIANVNIGPSGAEVGGAFGGEKETGGGRESGSDAWQAYMRRATNTVNYGSALPLAQGVEFV